jgi:hypothetical protein
MNKRIVGMLLAFASLGNAQVINWSPDNRARIDMMLGRVTTTREYWLENQADGCHVHRETLTNVFGEADLPTQAAADVWALANRPVDETIVPGNLQVSRGIILVPSTPGNTNGWALAVDAAGNVISAHWYGSPTSTVAEITSALASNATLNSTTRADLRQSKQDIAAIIALQNTIIDNVTTNLAETQASVSLTNGFTAAENRATVNTLRKELIDQGGELKATTQRAKDVAQELQDLRRIVLRAYKEEE